MKRRIIKQANQAYTLTLPIEWVRKNKLDAGSEVDVKENEKNLIVSSEGETEYKKIKIKFKEINGKIVRLYILALYSKGFDEITIESEKEISSEITNAINNTIGFALISQDENVYVIKDINSGNYQHLDEIFKRVFQMVLLFYDSAMNDIFGKEDEKVESLMMRDREVNKFCLFLQRAINKSSYPDVVNSRALFSYSYCLEKIGDEIERLWKTNIKNKIKKTKEFKVLTEMCREILGKSFDLYYRLSPEKIEEIYNYRDEFREKTLDFKSSDKQLNRILRHILKIVEDCVDLTHLDLIMRN